MMKLLKTLASGAAAAVLITGVIAVSARYVPAQEADDTPQVTYGPPIAQPEARQPFNFYGCWNGEIDVDAGGSGTGYLYLLQSGKKFTQGTNAELNLPDGSTVDGELTGSAGPVSFHLKYPKHVYSKSCHGRFDGRIESGNLVGTFDLKGCGVNVAGTFDFTFAVEPFGGCSAITD